MSSASSGLTFVTIGAILCFIMPYTTLFTLAILLYLDTKDIGFSLEFAKKFIVERIPQSTTFQWMLGKWITPTTTQDDKPTTGAVSINEPPQSYFTVPMYEVK